MPHCLCPRCFRDVPTRRHLRRQDPERRQTGRSPRGAAREVRTGRESEDGTGPRPLHPCRAPVAGHRGDAMKALALTVMLALGVLVAPLAAQAQAPATIRRIGMLSSGVVSPERTRYVEAFLHSLRDLGWVEGQNLAFAYRSAEGQAERLPDLAAELVRLQVEVM